LKDAANAVPAARPANPVPACESRLWNWIAQGDGADPPLNESCPIFQSDQCPFRAHEFVIRFLETTHRPSDMDSKITPIQSCAEIETLEQISRRWLIDNEIRYPPVPVSIVKGWLPIEICPVPLKYHHGAVWHDDDVWVVQLRDKDPYDVQRFTFFHEVFHILMHSHMGPATGVKEIPRGPFIEFLANWFSASLLMPKDWLYEYWIAGMSVEKLAALFQAPILVVYMRLRRLGLIS